MNTDIYDRVLDVLVDHLSVDKDKVKLEDHLVDDLGADSLDLIEIVMLIEDEFGVSIPDDIAENINTVQDIVDQLSTL